MIGALFAIAQASVWQPASTAKSSPAFSLSVFQAGADSRQRLLKDAWVDAQITAQSPSLCKSLSECGWNRSAVAYADVLSSKQLMFAEDASSQGVYHHSVSVDGIFGDTATDKDDEASQEERATLEMHAVRLSVVLQQSCMENGSRACWRQHSAGTPIVRGPRELKPISISFGEPQTLHAGRSGILPKSSTLIPSLKHFRLTTA